MRAPKMCDACEQTGGEKHLYACALTSLLRVGASECVKKKLLKCECTSYASFVCWPAAGVS
jgi:hypothetical protein